MKLLFKPAILAILSGLFLSLSWLSPVFLPFVFIGFIPLIQLEEHYFHQKVAWKGIKFFLCCILAFLIWNLGVTWWAVKSGWGGAIFYYSENTLYMSLVMMAYYFLAKWLRRYSSFTDLTKLRIRALLFITLWLSFEYIHLNWEFSWPWLHLGNVLSFAAMFAQWYEFTGVLGGSLWILLSNFLLFLLISDSGYRKKHIFKTFLTIFIPGLISAIMYYSYEEKGGRVEVVVVQPNVDTYLEKFSNAKNFIPYETQLKRCFDLAETKLGPKTEYIVLPETAYPIKWDIDDLQRLNGREQIFNFTHKHPHLSLIIGIESYKKYKSKEEATPTARYEPNIGYYDFFNTALQFNSYAPAVYYHKSKLLHGGEFTPYRNILSFIEPLAIYLGGFGTHGTLKERVIFTDKNNQSIAPVICYESLYGEFVTEYIQKGAKAIFIITNDGWWEDSPGARQHFYLDRLRAIENRRSIARSANTGISGIINQRGDIVQQTEYGIQTALSAEIKFNIKRTFYSRFGDYIGKTALGLSFFLTAGLIWFRIKRR